MRLLLPLSLCVAMSSLSGCCSLARLFCGPDRSPWISVRYDTPENAVATLLEAIRRDEPQIVYLSLAEEFQRHLGLDAAIAQLAWAKLREENPGLHVVGYAEVPPPVRRADNGATFRLQIEGTTVEIDVVQQAMRRIRWSVPTEDGRLTGDEGAMIASWNSYAKVEVKDEDLSELTLAPIRFHHDGLDAVELSQIDEFTLTRVWKVSRLHVLQPD